MAPSDAEWRRISQQCGLRDTGLETRFLTVAVRDRRANYCKAQALVRRYRQIKEVHKPPRVARRQLAEEVSAASQGLSKVAAVTFAPPNRHSCESRNPESAVNNEVLGSRKSGNDGLTLERSWQPRGVPIPGDVGLQDGSLTLVSFDPDIISRHPRPKRLDQQQRQRVHPEDLHLVRDKLADFRGGVILQLSTYDVNGDNPQGPVISSVNSILAAGEFTLASVVLLPGQRNNGFRQDMMSLVYARNVPWSAQLADLPGGFAAWARAIPARRG